jgi:hypothetical protein
MRDVLFGQLAHRCIASLAESCLGLLGQLVEK